MAATPRYRVQVFDFDGSFGIGAMVAEFEHAKNVGWSSYLNDIPEAFFTIDQDDPKIRLLRGKLGKLHVRIYRNDDLVWTGWAGMEHDSTKRDTVIFCYGYLAGLFFLSSGWDVTYTSASVSTIVSDAWTRAKTTITSSPLAFVSTGTIENPVTTSGGATGITIPTYKLYYKRLLLLMREMAALGIGNTTNTVVFEITHSTTPTFNFWKNRGVAVTDVRWRYGDGSVADFRDYQMPVYRRNELIGVGSAPNGSVLQTSGIEATTDISTWGRRQEPLYFAWVRDQTELDRATQLRLALAQRDQVDLTLRFHPNTVTPPGATGAGFKLSDRVPVYIDRGVTFVNDSFLVTGAQVVFDGVERTRLMLRQRNGS